jgi:hypothetical protein
MTGRPRKRTHGYAMYKLDGCRCYTCAYAVSVYEENRRRQITAGTWQPFVDAAEVRGHIEAHARAGIGARQLARLAGVDRKAIQCARTGRRKGRPLGRMQRAVAEKILAVPITTDAAAAHALIDATGAHRRIHALCAIGWGFGTQADLARRSRSNWHSITRRSHILPTTAALVKNIYDQLSMTPPPAGYAASRARAVAEREHWLPPLAGDDDTIDDPDAHPHLGLIAGDEDADEGLIWLALNGHLELGELPPAERTAVVRHQRDHRHATAAA